MTNSSETNQGASTANQTTTASATIPGTVIPGSSHTPKTYRKQKMAKRLDIVKRGSDNMVASQGLSEALAAYGYSRSKIAILVALYNEVIIANSAQQREFGEQGGAYSEFSKLYKTASVEYFGAVKISRVALKNNRELLEITGAHQPKKQSVSGLFDQMQTYFDNVLASREIMDILSGFGYNSERLIGMNKNYHDASDAYSRFYKEDSEAKAATRIRDEKLDAMDDFYCDLLTIAKVALAGKKELLGLLY